MLREATAKESCYKCEHVFTCNVWFEISEWEICEDYKENVEDIK